jgi:hypothetical protein
MSATPEIIYVICDIDDKFFTGVVVVFMVFFE